MWVIVVSKAQPQHQFQPSRATPVAPGKILGKSAFAVPHSVPTKPLTANAARTSIENLIKSANGTIKVAHELARIVSLQSLAEELEASSIQMDRLAAIAKGVASAQLDERSFRAALLGSIKLSDLTDGSTSEALQFHLSNLIRGALPDLGPSECTVLLCLIENSGEYVANHALQTAAKSRTPSKNIIKVYISRIRASLARYELSAAIQTGQSSYRIERRSTKLLLDAIGG
jgi:DNA-binding response OmpR family regulator